MLVIKIMGMAIVGTMLALILKEQKSYLGLSLGLVCALSIFFLGLPYLEKILSYVRILYSSFNGVDGYMSLLLKITGIATVVSLTSNLCKDAGMSAVSSTVELCGKVICVCLTLPVISDFFNQLLGVLP